MAGIFKAYDPMQDYENIDFDVLKQYSNIFIEMIEVQIKIKNPQKAVVPAAPHAPKIGIRIEFAIIFTTAVIQHTII